LSSPFLTRRCSYALALAYEYQSRTMHGRTLRLGPVLSRAPETWVTMPYVAGLSEMRSDYNHDAYAPGPHLPRHAGGEGRGLPVPPLPDGRAQGQRSRRPQSSFGEASPRRGQQRLNLVRYRDPAERGYDGLPKNLKNHVDLQTSRLKRTPRPEPGYEPLTRDLAGSHSLRSTPGGSPLTGCADDSERPPFCVDGCRDGVEVGFGDGAFDDKVGEPPVP
jgi:hypothetical protein